MSLPFDTILEILSCLELERSNHRGPWFHAKTILQPSLFSASLLNKTWNVAVTQLLYRDVFLAGTEALEMFSSTLEQREDLRSIVRSIFFTRAYSQDAEDWAAFDEHPSLERIFSICPNIHSRSVKADRAQPSMTFPGLRDVDFDSLTRLEIRAAGALPEDFSRLSLSMLEDLIIRGMKFVAGRKVNSPWPRMSRLRRLCLVDCDFSPAVVCLPRYPEERERLRALEIVGGDYSGYGLCEAIIRSCRSLEILTFLPSLSTPFRFDIPELRILRVSREHLQGTTPLGLPPDLLQLVLVGSRGDGDITYDFTGLGAGQWARFLAIARDH